MNTFYVEPCSVYVIYDVVMFFNEKPARVENLLSFFLSFTVLIFEVM